MTFVDGNWLKFAFFTLKQGWKPGYLALGCQFQFRCVDTQMSGLSFAFTAVEKSVPVSVSVLLTRSLGFWVSVSV